MDMFARLQTDRGIIRRVLRGHSDAFSVLVDRYGNMVYGVAYARLGNPLDAEDIAQDVFVRLYQWLDRIADRSSIGPWLAEVARNAATDLLRRRRPEVSLDSLAPDYAGIVEPIVTREETRRVIWEHLAGLDEHQREILVLHYFQGMKIQEIARHMGWSFVAAAKRLQRARDELGRRLIASVGDELVPVRKDRERVRRIMAAVAFVPVSWEPSPSLAVFGGAIAGVTAHKVLVGLAACLIIAAFLFFGGWHYLNRPYDTQEITADSTFSVEDAASVQSGSNGQRQDVTKAALAEANSDAKQSGSVRVEEPAMTIYGVVRDQTGRVVPGATVKLDNKREVEDHQLSLRWSSRPFTIQPIELSQVTDEQGRFSFGHVPFAPMDDVARMDLSARTADGVASQVLSDCVPALKARYCELILQPCISIRGRVIDKTNAGISGAKIRFFGRTPSGEVEEQAFSKDDGTFTVPDLVAMSYSVVVEAEGFVRIQRKEWIGAKDQELVFCLERGRSIAGRLLIAADSVPLPGVPIVAWTVNGDRAENTTDTAGHFETTGLPPGSYEVSLLNQGGTYVLDQRYVVELSDKQSVTGLELRAVPGASLSGHVVDEETNEPMPHVLMEFVNQDRLGHFCRAFTDNEGAYTVSPILAGLYKVEIRTAVSVTETNYTVPSLGVFENVDFRMKKHVSLRGTVVDTDGTRVAGASVVVAARHGLCESVATDDTGSFSVKFPHEEAPAYLQAYGEGRMSGRVGPIRAAGEYTLTLGPTARIEGEVVNRAGQPVANAYVSADPTDENQMRVIMPEGYGWSPRDHMSGSQATTSATGSFLIDPVLPGDYRINIYLYSSSRGYPAATAKVSVDAGKTLKTRLVVDTGSLASIEGTVMRGSAPEPGAQVIARPDSGNWIRSVAAETAADGRYTLTGLTPGEVSVTMSISEGLDGQIEQKQNVQLAAGETKTVDFVIQQSNCGIEGTITVDGQPILAQVEVVPSGTTGESGKATTYPDGNGYYHFANLQPGLYDVRVSDMNNRQRIWEHPTFQATVEVKEDETARCDFAQETGDIEGIVAGLRNGERAGIALFPGNADLSPIAMLDPAGIQAQMLYTMQDVGPGEPFRFENIPAGTYLIGAIVIAPDTDLSDVSVLRDLAKGRYALAAVDVFPGQISTAHVAIP